MKTELELQKIAKKLESVKTPRILTNGAKLTFETDLANAHKSLAHAIMLVIANKEAAK